MRAQPEARASIEAIAYALPEAIVTNEMLAEEHPGWDMARVGPRTGVMQRHIAADGETAFDLGLRAAQALFEEHPEARDRIDAILFCTESGDYVMPPNACLLHEALALPQDVFATDFNLACSGFVYGLGFAQSLLVGGLATNILLLTGDTYSRYVNPGDRSARTLFGDGVAATWIAASATGRGLVDIQLSTSGKDHRNFMIPAGGCRMPHSDETAAARTDENGNVRSLEQIHMDGAGVLSVINATAPRQARAVLERNGMTMDDIDLVVFHQASKLALDSLNARLRIPPEKAFSNLAEVGNTVSASIPIALRDAMDRGRAKRGDRLLLSAVGLGMSWGTAILEL